jgi:hypothetical protein
MIEKISAWVWLVLSVLMIIYVTANELMDYWLFTLAYFVGVTYFIAKYIEIKFKK